MTTEMLVRPRCMGHFVEDVGEAIDSSDVMDNVAELRRRMQEHGYLYLPGLLNRDEVIDARREVCQRLHKAGAIRGGAELLDAIVTEAHGRKSELANVARGNPQLERVLYAGAMMEFWRTFLGDQIRHFDFTWFRAMFPGGGTASHCDVVYMGRGTHRLYTAWTPIGDIDTQLGGLIVLERSNNHERLRSTYCQMDVDAHCTNKTGPAALDAWEKGSGGWLAKDPNQISRSLGGRWVTRPVYRAGDVILFSVYTVHAGMDNQSADRVRLSSDSRYQLASEPADERWIGQNPVGHGPGGKRGYIC